MTRQAPDSLAASAVEVNAIARRTEADARVTATVHDLAYAAGYAAGYIAVEVEEARLWSEALGIARQAAGRFTHAELERRQAEDCIELCSPHCHRCSRCIRADYLRRSA